MSIAPRSLVCLLLVAALAAPALGRSRAKELPRDPRQVPHGAQLALTQTKADLDGDGVAEGLVLVNALTGQRDAARATEVILGVTRGTGERDELQWVRHLMRETGTPAHDGELTAVDLDGDGGSEILLTWDRSLVDRREDRWAEIWVSDGPGQLRKVWDGQWLIDTRFDEQTPPGERTYLEREIDFGATRGAAGKAIVLRTTRGMVDGEVLRRPQVEEERVEVRLRAW
jgi:hypothetical protein